MKKIVRISPLFLPAGIFAAFFTYLLFRGLSIYSTDTTLWNYMGRRAFLNFGPVHPGLFLGEYLPGSPGLGLYSPFRFLYSVFEGYGAHHAAMTLLGFWGGVGAAVLTFEISGSCLCAALLSASFLGSGILLDSLHNVSFFFGACHYPWVIWAYLRLRKHPSVLTLCLLGVFLGWVCLEGDPIGMGLLAAALLFHAMIEGNRLTTVLSIALAFGISAISWLPAVESLPLSVRHAGIDLTEASLFSLHPRQLWDLLAPGTLGYPLRGNFMGQPYANGLVEPRFWFSSLFCGTTIWVLFLRAFFRKDKKPVLWVLAFLLVLVFLSFGKNGFLHGFLYRNLAVYRLVRFPARFIQFLPLILLPVAARSWREEKNFPLLLFGVATFSLIAVTARFFLFPEIENPGSLGRDCFFALCVQGAICLGALLCGLIARRQTQIAGVALVLLSMVELLLLAPPLRLRTIKSIDEPHPITDALVGRKNPYFRILRDDLLDRLGRGDSLSTLHPNAGVLSGVRFVLGYDPTMPEAFRELLGQELFQNFEKWSELLGIEYLLTPLSPRESFSLALESRGYLNVVARDTATNLLLLQTRQSWPFMEWIAKNSKDSQVVHFNLETNGFSGTFETHSEGRLRIRQFPLPGWKIRLNGERANWDSSRFNLEVRLPKGRQAFEIRFEPWSGVWGKRISRLSLFLSLLAVGLGLRARKSKSLKFQLN